MEFMRKAEAKSKESKDRMPNIVEAGALAAATTVKPHSLTSNNDITPVASFYNKDLIEEPFFNIPVPKMPPRRVNTIQHNLNISLGLMILLATSGFVMWNGEELRASWEKKKEKEKEKRLSEKSYLNAIVSNVCPLKSRSHKVKKNCNTEETCNRSLVPEMPSAMKIQVEKKYTTVEKIIKMFYNLAEKKKSTM